MSTTQEASEGARILHIITDLGNGGAEGALYRLATTDRQHHHEIISLRGPGKYGPLLEDAGLRVHCLGLSARTMVTALPRLARLIRKARPDVVQTWLYHADVLGGGVARICTRAPVVWGIRGAAIDETRAKSSTTRIVRLAARLSRAIPAHIVSCSANASRDHVWMGYPAGRISVVPNGYDLSRMRPDPDGGARMRAEFGLNPDTFLVGMAARFDPQKDHATLLDAMKSLRSSSSCKLVLAGRGCDTDSAELVSMIEQRGLKDRVILAGQQTDMPAFYSALDLHVLSSAYGEGFPNAVAEAMACGTPAIGTAVGETGLILGPHGRLLPIGDTQALALEIKRMEALSRDEPEKFAALGAGSRQHIIENFDISRMISGFSRAWSEVHA